MCPIHTTDTGLEKAMSRTKVHGHQLLEKSRRRHEQRRRPKAEVRGFRESCLLGLLCIPHGPGQVQEQMGARGPSLPQTSERRPWD